MPYIDTAKVLELDYQLRRQSKSGYLEYPEESLSRQLIDTRYKQLNENVHDEVVNVRPSRSAESRGLMSRAVANVRAVEGNRSMREASLEAQTIDDIGDTPLHHNRQTKQHRTSPRIHLERCSASTEQSREQSPPKLSPKEIHKLPAVAVSTPKLVDAVDAGPKKIATKSATSNEAVGGLKWRPIKSQETFHDTPKKQRSLSSSFRISNGSGPEKPKRRRLVKGRDMGYSSPLLDPALYSESYSS